MLGGRSVSVKGGGEGMMIMMRRRKKEGLIKMAAGVQRVKRGSDGRWETDHWSGKCQSWEKGSVASKF